MPRIRALKASKSKRQQKASQIRSAKAAKPSMATKTIKRPAAKPMNKKSLEIYKKLLVKLRDDIAGDIKNMRDEPGDIESKDVSGHVIHMADVATDMYDKEFNMGLESKDRVLLQKVEEALRRIDKGTFGVCLATGKPIAQARLKAIPYAEYCLEYQEELESKGKYR